MLTFYRAYDCSRCGDIEDALDDLLIAHRVIRLERNADAPGLPPGTPLPLLIDEGQVYQGIEAILKHLDELEAFRGQWYKFQSDACYCDAEGNVE